MAQAILVTLAAGLVRLIVAGCTPLFPDEAYYWDWSRHLAAGYFDHPPMIAWLIRLGTIVAGDTPLGVRLGPVLAGVAGALFLCATAKRIAGDRGALLTALVFAVMPLSGAGLVLATPDAPLLAAAAATIYALVRAFEAAPRSRDALLWWSIAGAALGIAFSSKYTAVLLPLGVLAGLLSRADLRGQLKQSGPYVATLVAIIAFSPVILWNARHDWVSFAFQLQHGFGAAAGSVMKRELDLIGGQAGLVSPILFVMMVVAVAKSFRAASPLSFLPFISAFVFAFFMYSATKRRVEANWPALAYIPGTLLLAAYAGSRMWDKWLRAGLVVAGVLTVITYINAFTPILPLPARRDPNARAAGWDDLARAVARVHDPRRRLSSYRTWVAGDRYQETAALAFHLDGHPRVFSFNISSRANQYDLWPTFERSARPRDAVILVVDDMEGTHPTVTALAPHFARVRQGDAVQLARKGDVVKNLRIWVLDGWLGTWPERALRSRP